jgi:hypothetical protein
MKMSIWNLLTILLLIGTFGMVVVFAAVFILPNQLLPVGMRPINIPPTLVLPTATETPFQFPPTWTKIPPLPTETNTPLPTNTPTLTNTPLPTNTIYVTPSTTLTPSKTSTYTKTATNTKNPIFVATGASKTASKTKVKTPTKTPTACAPGVCSILAKDDLVNPVPFPAYIDINVIANDTLHAIPVKIPRLFDCANLCETDKWDQYTTHQGGKVSIITKDYSTVDGVIRYTPPTGFYGIDSIDYKITTEGGMTSMATVTFMVTGGSHGPPSGIDSVPDPMSLTENLSAGTSVGTFSTTDPGDVVGPWIYSLVSGTGSTNNSYFSLSGDTLHSSAPVDREIYPTLSLRVRTTDSDGFYFEKVFTVTVNDVNEFPPVITSNGGGATASISIPEGTTAVTTVTSTDGDATSTRTYSISGGADLGLFTINASSGVLTFSVPPNFDIPTDTGGNNVYDVIVQVTNGSLTDNQSIAITVTNVP